MHLQVHACRWNHTLVAVKIFPNPNSRDPILGTKDSGWVSSNLSSAEANQIQMSLQRVSHGACIPESAEWQCFPCALSGAAVSGKLHVERACKEEPEVPSFHHIAQHAAQQGIVALSGQQRSRLCSASSMLARGKPLEPNSLCFQEAKMLAAIRHPNVLSFLGICTTPPALISEYCARGSLFDTLRQARLSPSFAKTELTWVVRLRMVSLQASCDDVPRLEDT
jgi:hypothetical protein